MEEEDGYTPETLHIPRVAQDVEMNKDLAAFSYIYIMSVVVYLLKAKDSAFIRYHSKQAMILFGLAVAAWFVPVIGPVIELILFAGMVLGFLHAAQGQWRDVPIVGPLSRGEMTVRDAWKQTVESVSSAVRAAKSPGPQEKGPPGDDDHGDGNRRYPA
jgi:uncharacterized membrane protein